MQLRYNNGLLKHTVKLCILGVLNKLASWKSTKEQCRANTYLEAFLDKTNASNDDEKV